MSSDAEGRHQKRLLVFILPIDSQFSHRFMPEGSPLPLLSESLRATGRSFSSSSSALRSARLPESSGPQPRPNRPARPCEGRCDAAERWTANRQSSSGCASSPSGPARDPLAPLVVATVVLAGPWAQAQAGGQWRLPGAWAAAT